MNRFGALLAVLGVSTLIACAPGAGAGNNADAIASHLFLSVAPPPGQPLESDLAQAERESEALIARGLDAERARLMPDAPALASDPELNEIARTRSQDMAAGAPFSHYDRDDHFVAEDMMRKRFGPQGVFGENILQEPVSGGFDAAAFARRAVEGWMNNPGHRRNILYAEYRRAGIGVVVAGGNVYATEVFQGPPHRGDGEGAAPPESAPLFR